MNQAATGHERTWDHIAESSRSQPFRTSSSWASRGRLRGVRFDLQMRYVERLLVPWKGRRMPDVNACWRRERVTAPRTAR